jgi:hypothetical protein
VINGWTDAPFSTSDAAVRVISGIVHFKGAVATFDGNTSSVPFVLPPAFRPSGTVYVPVDLCDATNGRLVITPNGFVSVEQQNAGFTDAACFTSLDGASFARSASLFTILPLKNGWKSYGFGTARASVRLISGVVHLRGAIRTSGNNAVAFVLPRGFRPSTQVDVQVDLCNANNGRLIIATNGTVFVEQEIGTSFKNAQCITSLDGATFAR